MHRASPTARSHDLVELDALRGIAITLVFLLHSEGPVNGFNAWKHGFGTWRSFMIGGHTGVSLFFILSGFLIARPFLIELSGGPRVSRTAYAARRVLRVMPLYVTFVLIAAIANAQQPTDVLRAVPYLFFLQAFPDMTSLLPNFSWVWWSLATEAHFYLVLPLAAGFGRRGAFAALAAALALYAAFVAGVFPPPTVPGPRYLAHSLIGRMPLFLFGIGAALVHRTWGARLRTRAAAIPWLRSGGADVILVAVLYALGTLLRFILRYNYEVLEARWPVWHVAEGGLWCAVLLLVLLAPLRSKPLLVNRVWTTLGLLSYSIYMIHVPFILWSVPQLRARWPAAMDGWSPTSIVLHLGIVAAVVAMATLTYLLIERPALAYKDARIPRALEPDRWDAPPVIRTPSHVTEQDRS